METSMEMISIHTTSTSIVVPVRAYLNIKSPNYVNTSQRGTSSCTSIWKALMHQQLCKDNIQPWIKPQGS